jgi:hypothetical protein
MIPIDLVDTYPIVEVSADLTSMVFCSVLKDGNHARLRVNIKPINNPLLPDVYNLGFGLLLYNGEVDDQIKLHHANVGKVVSTVLLFGLSFLSEYPDRTLGIDGTCDARAYMYHRMIQTNLEYLLERFKIIGVDWGLRLWRNCVIKTDVYGNPELKPFFEVFDSQRTTLDLYRYYMFRLV